MGRLMSFVAGPDRAMCRKTASMMSSLTCRSETPRGGLGAGDASDDVCRAFEAQLTKVKQSNSPQMVLTAWLNWSGAGLADAVFVSIISVKVSSWPPALSATIWTDGDWGMEGDVRAFRDLWDPEIVLPTMNGIRN